MATKKRSRAAASSGRPLKAVALVAGGIVGIFIASQAFASKRSIEAEPYTPPTPAKKPAKAPVKAKAPAKRPAAPLPAGGAEVLAKGQRSEKVLKLQQALIALDGDAGRIILENGGADGVFGEGTELALKAAYNKPTVSPSEYTNLLQAATVALKPKGGSMTDFLQNKGKKAAVKAATKPSGMAAFLSTKGKQTPVAKPAAKPATVAAVKKVASAPVRKPAPVVKKPAPKPAPKPAAKLALVKGPGPLKFTTKPVTNKPAAKAALKKSVNSALKAPAKAKPVSKLAPKLVLAKGGTAPRAVVLPARLKPLKKPVAAR